ncbi:hypothetical protein MIND_00907900 [Mycena indigotica]|uniref:F-box domain-containing protein n=1 Tax=Mycena indigotica TaxID=2126181 RepID=A0A8H6SEC1_9AGAR|nr:uncharacterized protein MIND_00907900 [Mycena indigotica]KAF7296772.1 hypothetical protein MIND_00907900 [Mycena indigotica]
MHRVLETAELVGLICSELSAADDKKSLARLARTSRDFTEQALDALWFSQHTIFNLIKLLPSDFWRLDANSRVVFRRPPNDNDFVTFHRYVPRIRVLSCSLHCMGPHLVLINLRNAHQGLWEMFRAPIFPNLRELVWNVPDNECGSQWLTVFLGPLLRSIRISFPDADSGAIRALNRSPNLGSLTQCELFSARAYPPAMEHISNLIPQLQAAKDLVIANLNVAAVQALGQLKHLETLDIFLPSAAHAPYKSVPEHSLPFPLLRQLKVSVDKSCGGDVLQLLDLFRSWEGGSAPLEVVEITVFEEIPSPVDLKDIFGLLVDRCEPTSLQNVELLVLADTTVIRQSMVSPHIGTSLHPLLRATNICHLDIGLPFGVDVDDVFLADAAQSWPFLTSLRLTCSALDSETSVNGVRPPSIPPPQFPGPRATLLGLDALARSCAYLTDLTLAVDTTIPAPESWPDFGILGSTLPAADGTAWPERNCCPLRSFDTENSRIANSLAVGWFLGVTFPELQRVLTPHKMPLEFFLTEAVATDSEQEAQIRALYMEYGHRWEEAMNVVSRTDEIIALGIHSYAELNTRLEWVVSQLQPAVAFRLAAGEPECQYTCTQKP